MRYRFTMHTALVLLLCFSACCPANATVSPVPTNTTSERNSRWAVPLQEEGLPNFFQVTPDLYRSAQPDEAGMRNAEKRGIRTVVSLRTSNKDKSLIEGTKLLLKRVPITTWNVGDDDIATALRAINDSPKPVLVHCLHGADRTGLIIALYRIVFQGWTKEEAKAEMMDGGYGFHSLWMNIPREIDTADIPALKKKEGAPQTTTGR